MVANEIQAIQKNLFYRITDFIKKKPVWTLVISAVSAIVLGAIGSVIASFVYEILK
jgi:zinc transporter ZupT